MTSNGKAQTWFTIVAPAESEAEGDRLFKLHAEWMEKTHHREGDKALLHYNVAKHSDPDGHIIFVLTEVYETVAGIENHSKLWHDADISDEFTKFISQCKVTSGTATVIQSLW
ncbi:MAG TPA: hypothetical protein VKQ72_14130 [Aggregatilineales bacterium]|nr:hypothetical protein [Aggregatilineales bacterium]